MMIEKIELKLIYFNDTKDNQDLSWGEAKKVKIENWNNFFICNLIVGEIGNAIQRNCFINGFFWVHY